MLLSYLEAERSPDAPFISAERGGQEVIRVRAPVSVDLLTFPPVCVLCISVISSSHVWFPAYTPCTASI